MPLALATANIASNANVNYLPIYLLPAINHDPADNHSTETRHRYCYHGRIWLKCCYLTWRRYNEKAWNEASLMKCQIPTSLLFADQVNFEVQISARIGGGRDWRAVWGGGGGEEDEVKVRFVKSRVLKRWALIIWVCGLSPLACQTHFPPFFYLALTPFSSVFWSGDVLQGNNWARCKVS